MLARLNGEGISVENDKQTQFKNEAFCRVLETNPFVFYYKDRIELTKTGEQVVNEKINNLITISKKDRKTFVDNLDDKREQIRQFFLEEMSTTSMGFQMAMDETVDRLKVLTDNDKVILATASLKSVINAAFTVKSLRFMGELIELSSADIDRIIEAYLAQSVQPTSFGNGKQTVTKPVTPAVSPMASRGANVRS